MAATVRDVLGSTAEWDQLRLEAPRPIALLVDQIRAADDPYAAIRHVNDVYKLSLRYLLSIVLALSADAEVGLTRTAMQAITTKWIRSKSRDLTEAERWTCIRSQLALLRTERGG